MPSIEAAHVHLTPLQHSRTVVDCSFIAPDLGSFGLDQPPILVQNIPGAPEAITGHIECDHDDDSFDREIEEVLEGFHPFDDTKVHKTEELAATGLMQLLHSEATLSHGIPSVVSIRTASRAPVVSPDAKLGKSTVAAKPLTKPKRALSAYNIFFKEERKRLLLRSGKTLPFSSLAKLIAQNWKTVPQKERMEYDYLSELDKDRYEEEMKAWKKHVQEETPEKVEGVETNHQQVPRGYSPLPYFPSHVISYQRDSEHV